MPNEVSRRKLMELSVAGAAALVGADARALSRSSLPDGEKIGFAIVGLGNLSQGQLIPGLRKARGARLVAVVSGHPEKAKRIAAAEGLPADAIYSYEEYDRIANDPRIQVVFIVLPNSMHAEYTIRALKAGKHVLCEKPMATTIADCEAMIAAAKAANRKLMIAYRCHYEPKNLEAMRRVRSGALGKPRLVVTDMGRQADPKQPSDAWRLDGKMSGNGALGDMGVYGVSAARYLLNEEPVEVRAWSNTDRNDPRFATTHDLISWQFRFPSGAICNGSTSFNYNATMSYEIWGEKARLRADPGAFYGGNKFSIVNGGNFTDIDVPEIDQFAREMDWMADVVRGKAPLVSPGEEGLQDMRLMKAITDSLAKGGAPVRTDWGYKRAVDPAAVVDIVA
ncbi:MAG TPA: Gfo/Idh/MocA family oxidoreductase [Sphingomonas sp.]|nr:Gfo/Idh/MocA family oxidoreductase [Sphingomonas sp.]